MSARAGGREMARRRRRSEEEEVGVEWRYSSIAASTAIGHVAIDMRSFQKVGRIHVRFWYSSDGGEIVATGPWGGKRAVMRRGDWSRAWRLLLLRLLVEETFGAFVRQKTHSCAADAGGYSNGGIRELDAIPYGTVPQARTICGAWRTAFVAFASGNAEGWGDIQ